VKFFGRGEGGGGHSTTIPPFPLISIDHNVEVELKEGTTTPMVESEENFWCSRTFNNLPLNTSCLFPVHSSLECWLVGGLVEGVDNVEMAPSSDCHTTIACI